LASLHRRRWSHRSVNNLPIDAISSPLAPIASAQELLRASAK
jgi:hypothetical protein